MGIVYQSVKLPVILSICRNCSTKSIYLKDEGQYFEFNNAKYTKNEFLSMTCDEFIIKGIIE